MSKKLKILEQQVLAYFPQATPQGVKALAKILEQCCCSFDPCNINVATNNNSFRIESYINSGTILQENTSNTSGLIVGSTVITNSDFNNTNVLIFRGKTLLSKIDNGTDMYYTQNGNTITLSSPLTSDEHILIYK